MKILHYSLGFPPYRSGGMTTFCMDLMQEQKKLGHQVSLLWPGEMKFIHKKISIVSRPDIGGIGNFELQNPLPVPLDEGILQTKRFMQKLSGDEKATIKSFLQQEKPDAIHIHTFMGLHKEFLEVAGEMGIRTVFTSHDYYPFCPRVTLFRGQGVCDCVKDCSGCPECNKNALSLWKIWLMQSPIYRGLKDSALVRKLRTRHRNEFWSEQTQKDNHQEIPANGIRVNSGQNTFAEYKELRTYYLSMLGLIDVIHFNSELAKETYRQYIANENVSSGYAIASCVDGEYVGKQREVVVPITNSVIGDHRKSRTIVTAPATLTGQGTDASADQVFVSPLRIAYLGAPSVMKGFPVLKQALDLLWQERQDFILNVYFDTDDKAPYLKTHPRYDLVELESVLEQADVVVVPSLWNETFGFVAMEALSYGVPVILSDHVGAKDMVPEGCGIVVEDMDAQKLARAIGELTPKKLRNMNQNILSKMQFTNLEYMTEQIIVLYGEICAWNSRN